MTLKDIKKAFEWSSKISLKQFIYDTLIEQGYVRKMGRYFAPQKKLFLLAFVPEKLVLNDYQRRWFTTTNSFYGKEAIEVLDENEQLFKHMIVLGMFKQSADKRYRKTDEFTELLIEGENTFVMKEEQMERFEEVVKGAISEIMQQDVEDVDMLVDSDIVDTINSLFANEKIEWRVVEDDGYESLLYHKVNESYGYSFKTVKFENEYSTEDAIDLIISFEKEFQDTKGKYHG